MASKEPDYLEIILEEFEKWHATTSSETIFMLDSCKNEDGSVQLSMLLGSEMEFKLLCPANYPKYEGHFYVEGGSEITLWANALNEFLLDSPNKLSLLEVLNKADSLFINEGATRVSEGDGDISMEDELPEEDEDEEEGAMILSDDDDSAFTTEWELKVARKKKRWVQKERELREELKNYRPDTNATQMSSAPVPWEGTSQEKVHAKQIFTSTAASGILTNDLVKIMEKEDSVGITADPIEDNIYKWCVKLRNFLTDSDLANDFAEINKQYNYDYIELQLDFAIDLYPFYPPLVKVVRPRLQASMMQRVTNMEMLKLSYWNPAKDMLNVLVEIKGFLQQWARLDLSSERNDKRRFPCGSYVYIEHHLLRLALVSEVNPRANQRYHLEVEKVPEAKPAQNHDDKDKKKKDEYWERGVGYGHNRRPEWDIHAYVAAQKEKDKQVESVLHKILHELKVLYANHAPQMHPRTVPKPRKNSESIDPVEDTFNILESSALIPFIEQYLKADSFLEICRHTSVYKVIVDIIKEIAMQAKLVPLLGALPDQQTSLYQHLSALSKKANILLQHICKAGNGAIPKPVKRKPKGKKRERSPKSDEEHHQMPSSSMHPGSALSLSNEGKTAEEKLAREFQVLFKDVTEAFQRAGLSPDQLAQGSKDDEAMDITIETNEFQAEESKYQKIMKPLHFDEMEFDLEGSGSHHYTNDFKKSSNPSKAQVFRIAQELSSLSTSLPLNLSSSVFVRSDTEKLTLMKVMITGPEGTPYAHGCFVFDIFFPAPYPKTPPMVNLQTTGGGTVRFNPNLYNCGKVCLSLLGTWEGQQGEQWNETTSTVLQVLVSIQSLILVPEPYFNEPGYEQEIGTDAGKRHSSEYNLDVQCNSIKYAMVAMLQNPTKGFEDVIKSHFYLKKDRILQDIESWVKSHKSSKLERAYQNLKAELNKLQPPPNIINLTSATTNKSNGGGEGDS